MNVRRLLCALVLLVAAPLFAANEKKATPLSPVATVKAFFLALADGDQAKIKALAMPNPKLKTLYATVPTKEEQELLRQTAQEQLNVLRPGEMVPMQGGVMTVPASPNVAFVYAKSMEFPLPLHRVDGIWKVNVAPMINARETALAAAKAAEAARVAPATPVPAKK